MGSKKIAKNDGVPAVALNTFPLDNQKINETFVAQSHQFLSPQVRKAQIGAARVAQNI